MAYTGQRFKNTITATSQSQELSQFLHPDYVYYKPEWEMIRDCIAGERRIKSKDVLYLLPLESKRGASYEFFKSRAVFVNMVARTVMGLVGTIFRRPMKTENVGDLKVLENVTLDGMSFNLFGKKLAFEIVGPGRVGVLVDMPKGDSERVYMTEYIAENILCWRTTMIKGRRVLNYVLLREIVDETPMLTGNIQGSPGDYGYYNGQLRARYRVLMLVDGTYKQRLYDVKTEGDKEIFSFKEGSETVPQRGGVPLDFIPFVVMGSMSATPEIQKSPVIDIAQLNIHHYQASALLEHGRFYTALPVYVVPVNQSAERSTYEIGPSVVWEVPIESNPKILEYFGTGLKTLSDSLIEKEEHIAQLGGRIMGIRPAATAESDNIFKMKQANEMSILLNITESMMAGLTQALRWYLWWQRATGADDAKVIIHQDFKDNQITARELRAFALLYQAGILPIDEVWRTLQANGFIAEEVTLEEFKAKLLAVAENFPNQPDVDAMSEGYVDAKDRLKDQMSERDNSMLEGEAERERQNQLRIDQRMLESSSDLQSQMFQHQRRLTQMENQERDKDRRLDDKHKSRELKIKEKVANKPVPKPAAPGAARPAAKKPAAK